MPIIFRRSFLVPSAGFGAMEDSLREWREAHAAGTPGFAEILLAENLDDDSRAFVTIECTARQPFENGGSAEIEDFTRRVHESVDGKVEFFDTSDVREHVAPGVTDVGTPKGNVYRSHWFTAGAPDQVVEAVETWQDEDAGEIDGYSRSWLIQGIGDPRILAVSTEWTGEEKMRSNAPEAMKALFDRLEPNLSSEIRTLHVRGGGDLEWPATRS